MEEEYCGKIKKVGEFAEADTFNDSDVLFAEQNGKARKLPGEVLKRFVQSAVRGYSESAGQAAMSADLSASAAAQSADRAAQAASSAEQAKTNADLSARTAENAASTATQAESAAKQAAETAYQSANEAGQSEYKAAQSAAEAEAARYAVAAMEVFANTLAAGMDASVSVEMKDGGFVLSFGLPKGDKGDPLKFEDLTSPQKEELRGERGDSGVTAPVGGFFTLAVDANGDLWVYSEDNAVPQFEFDAESGELYVLQEV